MKENKKLVKRKPYVLLCSAMSIDGKIASRAGDSELSDEQDWKEVHKIRSTMDAILVGKETILKDNPKLHIKFHEHNGYYRIVVDSKLTIPLDSNVINFHSETYPTIICTTEQVPIKRIRNYEALNVRIIQSGTGQRVDLVKLMPILYKLGIHSILLEGGGTLNWSFIKNDLVDEIRLTIAPWIIGGKDAVSLVEGEGFKKMIQGRRFNLLNINKRDNYVVLNYKRNEK